MNDPWQQFVVRFFALSARKKVELLQRIGMWQPELMENLTEEELVNEFSWLIRTVDDATIDKFNAITAMWFEKRD